MYNPYLSQLGNEGQEQTQGQGVRGNVQDASAYKQQQPQQPSYWNNDAPGQQQGNPYMNQNGTNQHIPQQQQHHQQQQQQQGYGRSQGQGHVQGQGQGHGGSGMNTFFSDPTTQMGLQFSQTAFNASQQYMQQNLGQFVSNENVKYYFKVSNAYVLKKLLLIVFPYRNKSWIRQVSNNGNVNGAHGNGNGNGNGNGGVGVEGYATPIDDINAPDLYIPTMAFLSYILVWAIDAGMRGDFHPEMLGYATTRTLAFYLMDFILLRVSFYILGIGSKNSKLWDLVSYTGYKFVPILLLLIIEILTGQSMIVRYAVLTALVFSHGFFMMRSLRYVVFPNGGNEFGGESRIRLQYLFLYCFVVQGVFVWLLT